MKNLITLNNLCAMTLVLVISSCATGNKLTFVKSHPANTLVAVNNTTHTAMPVEALPTPVIKDNTGNKVIVPPVNDIAAIPNGTSAHHKALTVFNKHISIGTLMLMHAVKNATATHAKPVLRADGDGDNGGLRTGILLIVIGLLMQLFWVLPNIGYIFAVIGSILIIIGIIELILWLL